MTEPREDDLRDAFGGLRAPRSTASYATGGVRGEADGGSTRGSRRWPPVLASVMAGVVILAGAVVAVGLRGPRMPSSAVTPALGTPTAPSARLSPAMAYDSTAGLTVLYGGIGSNGHCCDADTWTWDGSSWHALGIGGPVLSSAVMTDDPADGGVLLLGETPTRAPAACGTGESRGVGGTPAGTTAAPSVHSCPAPDLGPAPFIETWLWRAGTWDLLDVTSAEASAPPATSVLGVVPGTGQIIAVARAPVCEGLCPPLWVEPPWVWSHQGWTQAAQSYTVPLNGTTLLIPVGAGRLDLVMLQSPQGHCAASDFCRTILPPPSWRWQDGGWTADPRSGIPPYSTGTRVAPDGDRVALLTPNALWTFDGTTWTKSPAPLPPGAHTQAGFAADRNGNYVLFGGLGPHGIGNDTWLLTSTGWHLVAGSPATPAPSPPCPAQQSCVAITPISGVVTVPARTVPAAVASP